MFTESLTRLIAMVQSRIRRLLVVSILLGFSFLLGHAEGQTCEDFETLANFLINTTDNKYQLSIAFFPTERAPPAFVKVIYHYDDNNVTNQTWVWSSGAFYFFQPLQIFQYTSLFFGNPDFRTGNVALMLPADCANVSVPIMETLTQRLKLIASSQKVYPEISDKYQAKAASAKTVTESFYIRDGHSIISLIHTIQVVFPIFSCVLFLLCFFFYWRRISGSRQFEAPSDTDWSTFAAYCGVSFYFTLFAFCLDCTALHHRLNGAEFIIDDENLKSLVYGPFIFDLLALVFIIAWFIISDLCVWRVVSGKSDDKSCDSDDSDESDDADESDDNVRCGSFCRQFWCTCTNINEEYTGIDRQEYTGIDRQEYTKWQFVRLSLAGLAPFLCITSHAHFILIAWITDPAYASGIGAFYGILFYGYFLTFKFLYHECVQGVPNPCSKGTHCAFFWHGKGNKKNPGLSRVALFITLGVGLLLTGYVATVACFFILIPINQSIEDTPTQVYAMYQGIIIVLLAYVFIVKRGSFSIFTAVKKALKRIDGNNLNNEWMKLSDEEKLAEIVTRAVDDYIPRPNNSS